MNIAVFSGNETFGDTDKVASLTRGPTFKITAVPTPDGTGVTIQFVDSKNRAVVFSGDALTLSFEQTPENRLEQQQKQPPPQPSSSPSCSSSSSSSPPVRQDNPPRCPDPSRSSTEFSSKQEQFQLVPVSEAKSTHQESPKKKRPRYDPETTATTTSTTTPHGINRSKDDIIIKNQHNDFNNKKETKENVFVNTDGRVTRESTASTSAQGNEEVTITIMSDMYKSFVIKTRLSRTVDQVKCLIQDKLGFPPDQQRLIYEGKQLEDGRLLSNYVITRSEVVFYLVFRLRGS